MPAVTDLAAITALLAQYQAASALEAVLSPPWGASHTTLPVAALRRLQKKLPRFALGDWPVVAPGAALGAVEPMPQRCDTVSYQVEITP